MHIFNVTENSKVLVQTPPMKGGVLAWIALFSVAHESGFAVKDLSRMALQKFFLLKLPKAAELLSYFFNTQFNVPVSAVKT